MGEIDSRLEIEPKSGTDAKNITLVVTKYIRNVGEQL